MPRRTSRPLPVVPARPPIQEQLLIDLLPELTAARVLCTSVGRGQFARGAAERWPDAGVTCHFLDLYYATETEHEALPTNLQVVCAPDFPEAEYDLAAVPLRSSGDAELAREKLQEAHVRLAPGGRLVASTDNARDQWLHGELQKLFPKVTRRPLDEGVVYLATKTEPLKKRKSFESRFAMRDKGRLLQLVSRPGVFSHRRVDAGARALLKELRVRPGQRLLDMGCGCGVIALAAATRAPGVEVVAVDSDARAVQCTQLGAELNQLENVQGVLNCTGDAGEAGSFDLVTGNPPYFSQYQIADLFLRAAFRALRPGGQVVMVTKTPHWYLDHMPAMFHSIQAETGANYTIVTGLR